MKTPPTPPRKHIDRSDLFWLAYLAFFFIEPVFRRSVPYWLESLGIAAVFVSLYLTFLQVRRFRLRLLCLAGMVLLGALTFPFNGGAIGFFIYAAALLPFVIASVPTILLCFFAESVVMVLEAWRLHLNPYDAGLGVFFVIVG